MEILLCGRTHHGIFRQHHDAIVAGADTELVLGADHAEGLDSAYLGFLDLEVSGEHGAYLRKQDLLAGCYVGGAANYGDGLAGTGIDPGDMQMVAVRMWLALKYVRHDDSGKAAGNLLGLFQRIHLYAYGCHGLRNLGGGEIALQIIL